MTANTLGFSMSYNPNCPLLQNRV